MSEPLAKPGEVVIVRPLGTALESNQRSLLVKTDNLEVTQLTIPAGSGIPTHEARGEVILHCVEGWISLTAIGVKHDLKSGQLLYLSLNEPFSIHGREDSSVLVTIILPKQGVAVEFIG